MTISAGPPSAQNVPKPNRKSAGQGQGKSQGQGQIGGGVKGGVSHGDSGVNTQRAVKIQPKYSQKVPLLSHGPEHQGPPFLNT